MKAYKATRNMKCKTITYEVGKTYTFHGKMKMCEQGFHFCENPMDIIQWYSYDKDFVLMEIEVLGEVEKDTNKSVTNKFKVTRIIPKEEYPELIGITLDSKGNMIKKVYSNGNTYLYEYDSNGNMIKEVHSNGNTYLYEYEYDSNGNKIKQVNPDGETHLWEYDSNGNKIKQVYPNGNTSLWEYDSNGNKTKQVNPNGSTWSIAITD